MSQLDSSLRLNVVDGGAGRQTLAERIAAIENEVAGLKASIVVGAGEKPSAVPSHFQSREYNFVAFTFMECLFSCERSLVYLCGGQGSGKTELMLKAASALSSFMPVAFLSPDMAMAEAAFDHLKLAKGAALNIDFSHRLDHGKTYGAVLIDGYEYFSGPEGDLAALSLKRIGTWRHGKTVVSTAFRPGRSPTQAYVNILPERADRVTEA